MSHAAGVAVSLFQSPFLGAFPQNQTIFISPASASGHTPKAAIFVLVGADSLDTIDTVESAARMSVGFTDGTNHRCVAFFGEHNVIAASADTGYRIDTDTVIQQSGTAGEGLNSEASFVSFGTDSVTIQWSASPGGRYGYVVYFYGDNVQANVTSFASSSATTSTTAPGFQPDIIFGGSVGQAFVADGSGAEAMISLGFAARLPSITQCCHSIVGEDRQSATSSGCDARNDSIIAILTSVAAVVTETVRLAVSAFGANGFSVDRSAAVSVEAMYLSLKGYTGFCAAPDTDVTGLGAHSITGVGFKPYALFLLGTRVVVNTPAAAAGGLSLAAITSATTSVCASVHFRDNQATSEATTSISATDVFILQSATGTTYDWKGDFDSFDQDGFTFSVNDVALASRAIPFMALGPAPFVAPTEAVAISDAMVMIAVATSNEITLVANESVAISDAARLLHSSLQVTEDVAISDATHFHTSVEANETISIMDDVRFRGTGVGILISENIGISEGVVLVLGQVLTPDQEAVLISDQANFGAGPVATVLGRGRGKTVQDGAVIGTTAQDGAQAGSTEA